MKGSPEDIKKNFIDKFNNTPRHKYYLKDSLNLIKDGRGNGEGARYSQGTKADIYNSFKPLLDNNKMSVDDLVYLADKYGRFAGKEASYPTSMPDEPKILHNPRTAVAKQLGDITFNALGKLDSFKKLKLENDLNVNTSTGKAQAYGFFEPKSGEILWSKNLRYPDILSTLIHEGNHAIESPFNYSMPDFRKDKTQSSYFPPNNDKAKTTYTQAQNILNIPSFTKNYPFNYPATPDSPNLNFFKEMPAHALQSLAEVKEGTPFSKWKIDDVTKIENPDGRKYLRRLMKDTHQIYKQYYGQAEPTQPEINEPYSHNKEEVSAYKVPKKYSELNQAFLNTIQELRKPENLRKSVIKPVLNSSIESKPFETPYSRLQSQGMQPSQPYGDNQHTMMDERYFDNRRTAHSPPQLQRKGQARVYGNSGGNSPRALSPQGNPIGQNLFGASGDANIGNRTQSPQLSLNPNIRYQGTGQPQFQSRGFGGFGNQGENQFRPNLQPQGGLRQFTPNQQAQPSLMQLIQNKQLARRIRGNSDANPWQ